MSCSGQVSLCTNHNEPYYEQWKSTLNSLKPSPAPLWAGNEHLVFTFDRTLYTARADGTKLDRLSKSHGKEYEVDGEPSISPDGRRLAYATTRHKVKSGDRGIWRNFDIEVVDLDGSDRKRLTDSPAQDVSPSWSSDGQRVLFDRVSPGPRDAQLGMHSVGTGGGEERLLWPDGHVVLESRTGKTVAYLAWDPDPSIFATVAIRHFESREPVFLSPLLAVEDTPVETVIQGGSLVWSLDGDQVAFVVAIAQGQGPAMEKYRWGHYGPPQKRGYAIRALNVSDGSVREFRLPERVSWYQNYLTWAPGGDHLLLTGDYSSRDPNSGRLVAIADLRTGTVQELTRGEYASWSPDGSRIAVVSYCYKGVNVPDDPFICKNPDPDSGFWDYTDIFLYTMNPDGSGLQAVVSVTGERVLKAANDANE